MVDLDISLLGPVRVSVSDVSIPLRARERSLLAVLALRAGRPVPPAVLIDALWGPAPPGTARNTVQVHVMRLRRALGAGAIVTTSGGYTLGVDVDRVDIDRFHRLTRAGTHALADSRPRTAARQLREALSLWRGPPLADCAAHFVAPAVARLEELRLGALEGRIAADLATGSGPGLVPELLGLCTEHPYRETLHAALVTALGRSGQTKAALDAYATIRRRLVDELGMEPGSLLRNAHRALLASDIAPTFTASMPTRPQSRGPTPTTRTIARDGDMRAVMEMLGSGASRLISILGPGGIGKTRVASDVAPLAARTFADGVCWVDVAGLADADAVAPTVAQVLGCQPGPSALDAITATLTDRELLLVLDNLEHLLPRAAEVVARLLSSSPGLTVLATSRRALRLQGEQRWSMRGLAAPTGNHAEAVEVAPASALFLERARAVRPAPPLVPLDDITALAVARLCRQLDGNPLALEIAAARCNVVTPSELLSRVGDQLSSLSAPGIDASARHRSLRATLQSSIGMLSESERRLLQLLSVFRGGFTLDAAEELAGDVAGRLGAVEGLAVLEDASLVIRTDDPRKRFELLETVREHSAEMLRSTGGLGAARAAHLKVFVRQFCPGGRVRLWPQTAADISARAQENDNVRAAVAFAGSVGERLPFAQLSLAYSGWRQLAGGLGAELDAWLGDVLAEPPDSEMQIAALWARAVYAWYTGRAADARSLIEQASAHPDFGLFPEWQAMSLSTHAAFLGELNPADARIPLLIDQAHETAQSSHDPDTIAYVLNSSAAAYTHRDPNLSLAYLTQLSELPANCLIRFACLSNLADAQLARGCPSAAEAHVRDALDLQLLEHAPSLVPYAMDLLGTSLLGQGRAELARAPLLTALRVADWGGDLRITFEVIQRLAALSAVSGDPALATTLAAGATAHLERTGVKLSEGGRWVFDSYLADLPLRLSDPAHSAAAHRGRSLSRSELVALAMTGDDTVPAYPV